MYKIFKCVKYLLSGHLYDVKCITSKLQNFILSCNCKKECNAEE